MPSNHNRLWQCSNAGSEPSIPEWMDELWTRNDSPRMKRSEYDRGGQALLWFVTQWVPSRSPYRFSLPRELITWLNAPEADFANEIAYHPGLRGSVRCGAPKPVSRFMFAIADQYEPHAVDAGHYYNFLAWYICSFMPARNVPGVLLPSAIVDLLNAPADDDVPLTVGMILYLRHAYPEECNDLRTADRDRLLALSFCAVEGMLSSGHSRLIPSVVSRFWRRRPLKLVTAFEYVAASANNRFVDAVSTGADGAAVERELRNWFQREFFAVGRCGALMSGALGYNARSMETPEAVVDHAVIIYRDHDTVCGLSKGAAAARNALVEIGLPIIDLHFSLKRERLSAELESNQASWANARRRFHLVNINPEFVPECCLCNASRIWPDDYIVGQFYWELSRISKVHECGIQLVDEIWTASKYLADIYAAEFNGPVVTMGQSIIANEPAVALNRDEFGFADDAYLFLCNFDVQSVVERKNPLGAVIAFQTAFPRGREHAGLVIKTRNLQHFQTERDREHWAEVVDRIRKDPRIRVIDHTMSDDALAALYRMCDCFVSLHRSEGFGFGPAEAMAHGRPAIVTNYSGVCDFCTTATAKLVPYELIRVQDNQYPYLDSDRVYQWADPDLMIAAECMRELAEDREQSRQLGGAAQEFISREFSVAALRSRYLNRLRELGFVDRVRESQCAIEC